MHSHPRTRIAAISVLVTVTLAGVASGQTSMTKAGFFDPDGAAQRPFSLLPAALCAAPNNGTIQIGPGVYHDTGVFSDPAILMGTTGPATLGITGAQRTTFSVVTYNTHLFGDLLLGAETFKDAERASYIAKVTGAEPIDVLGLQELWDGDFWNTMVKDSGFVSGFYGSDHDDPLDVLHSGLALFGRSTLAIPQQYFYTDERGEDAFASKGFIRATIIKDGFPITIFNTHTQAGSGTDNEDTRFQQLLQLAGAVQGFRAVNPGHVVIVMGDFNVPGETAEHYVNMRSAMVIPSLHDGGPNFRCSPDSFACTSCSTNELKQYFSGSGDTRLDYILYAPSLDGSVDIVPTALERREFQIPAGKPDLCDNGWCIRDLSDHYGLFMQFDIHHN
ncbi:MAG: endonuclease/exonuclease/phosphatase family protein [Phycisphaerales bacterium]|nr:endonuclease/exonuclease/phosphatase family protein [Phycisphaerales bacterium]